MARFLLCWEFGGGLGHAGRLKPLTQALMRRGHQVDLVLHDLVHTRALLADLAGVRILQAPLCLHTAVGLPQPPVSLPEILLAQGYLSAAALGGMVAGWRGLMDLIRPDVLVADYAPTATLAARTLGLPVASIGTGFCVPPDEAPLPAFRHHEAVPPERLAAADRRVREAVDAVLQAHGRPPLTRLAELFRGDRALLCTWPELDHYRRAARAAAEEAWLGPSILPAGGAAPAWPVGTGPAVFAYLLASHADHAAVLQALAQAGCRVLCYLPEVVAGKPEPVRSPLIRYATGPVHVEAALQTAQLTVSHGGEATVTQSLLAGVPLLLLPSQAEQFLMAQRIEEAGAGINAGARPRPTAWGQLIAALLHDPSHVEAARRLARQHEDFTHEGQIEQLVHAFESLLPPERCHNA